MPNTNQLESSSDPHLIYKLIEPPLGSGSYGQVFQAVSRLDGSLYAIKIVNVENDTTEVEREVSILKACRCEYIVQYYGTHKVPPESLWIVIEYCGGGSISDVMAVREETLSESQIATVCKSVLKGLDYLHRIGKIHRDIKAGNVLLKENGDVKLADFGVSGELTKTMSKCQTVIGTPYWMAPEVIQEERYNGKADIWSLGITCIEMAEGRPPHSNVHAMRAMFLIPTKPPPVLNEEMEFSDEFRDFVSQCLIKDPKQRPAASELLKHPFITKAKSTTALTVLIDEVRDIFAKAGGRDKFFEEREKQTTAKSSKGKKSSDTDDSSSTLESDDDSSDYTSSTMIKKSNTDDSDSDTDDSDFESSTMIKHNTSTMRKKKKDDGDDDSSSLSSLDSDSDDQGTMVVKKTKKKNDFSSSGTMRAVSKQNHDQSSESDEGTFSSGTMVVKKNTDKASDEHDSDDDLSSGTSTDAQRTSSEEISTYVDSTVPDDIRELAKMYNHLSVEEIDNLLGTLDEQMEKEITSIRHHYKQRREALQMALNGK